MLSNVKKSQIIAHQMCFKELDYILKLLRNVIYLSSIYSTKFHIHLVKNYINFYYFLQVSETRCNRGDRTKIENGRLVPVVHAGREYRYRHIPGHHARSVKQAEHKPAPSCARNERAATGCMILGMIGQRRRRCDRAAP